MTALTLYRDRLTSIPSPGGNGCHPDLLGCANLGIMAGIDPATVHEDIRRSIPPGARRVPDREIQDAIRRAMADHNNGTYAPPAPVEPTVMRPEVVMGGILKQARHDNEYDLWEASPIGLVDGPERDPTLFLKVMFEPHDLVFIGDRHDSGILSETIRTCYQWIEFFQAGNMVGPFIIVNPLSGKAEPKKSGDGKTLRGDACVAAYRHVLCEFDSLDFQTQIKFWTAVKLPVKALVYSGNKSIHAWLDVPRMAEVDTPEAWAREVKGRLFRSMLEPVGADPACGHPARLARLPGFYRAEKSEYQRILWLS